MNLLLSDPAFLSVAATVSGGGAAWTPANLTTSLWLDGDDANTITIVSGAVSQWSDKSGNSIHGAQSTASARPTLDATGINSKPALSFNGTSNNLVFPTGFLNGATEFTVAMVLSGPLQSNDGIWGPLSSNLVGLQLIWANVVSKPTLLRINGVDKSASGLWSTNSSPTITTITASSASTAGWLNGSAVALASGTGISALNFNGVYSMGAYASGQWAQMLMGEFIILPSSVAQGDREKLEGYLAHKWGLTADLPSGHPYKSIAPTV